MITFIFPIKKRKIGEDFLENFNIFSDEVQVYFALDKGNEIKLNEVKGVQANIAYFNEGTREEDMIESLISKINTQTLVFVRDGENPLSFDGIRKCVVKQREGYDIVLMKKEKKQNRFKDFFSNILKNLASKMFGFKFFDGELTVQVFGANAINILKMNGTGNLSKINRWVGANIGYVDGEVERKNFKDSKFKKSKISTVLYALAFMIVLAGSIMLGVFINLPWLAILGLILVNFVSATLFVYNLLSCHTRYKVGDLTASKVAIIDFMEVKNDEQW